MKKNINKSGKEYWRSFEQLADTPEFKSFLHREFPENASEMNNSFTRRKFISLMGASMAFAGLAGCRRPVEKIIPYVIQPEEITPGVPNYYATTMPFGAGSFGVVVESNEGRPTKIEGNEQHPSSLGSANSWIEASILNLYDPDRAKTITNNGSDASWNDFITFWNGISAPLNNNGGSGLGILTESFSSPTLFRLANAIKRKYPNAVFATYDPVNDENIYEGVRNATGTSGRPLFKYENAKRVLTLDCDFITEESENISNVKGFSNARRVSTVNDEMNRLYVVESGFSLTGGMADHRLRVASANIAGFTAELAIELKNQGLNIRGTNNLSVANSGNFNSTWITELAKDLIAHTGESLVVAGRGQPAAVHALVYAINESLSNIGNTVVYHGFTDTLVSNKNSLNTLANGLDNGSITTVVVLGSNPVYNAPGHLYFQILLRLPGMSAGMRFGIHYP